MRAIVTTSIAAIAAIGCSSATEDGTDDLPPTIEITSPQRGTMSDSGEVTVTGFARDDGGSVRVTLQGQSVPVGTDGAFTATLTVEPGITVLETAAVDSGGKTTRDVRAVMAGDVAPSDGSVAAPLGARLSPAALATVASSVANAAKAIDFTAAAKAMNPVYNNTGCLGARIDITSVTLSNITASMVPKAGALDTTVNVSNLVVKLNANYKVACIGGSTTITARATTARVRDDITAQISSNKIATALPSPTVTLEGFSVDVGGVPGAIESLLRDQARKAAESRLASIIQARVPALANAQLAGLIAKPVQATLLGHPTQISVVPSQVELASTGMFVAVDSSLVVTGGEGGSYVSTPMPITSDLVAKADTLGVAIADDVVNQLFAGLWAAGAFDISLAEDKVGVIATLIDDDVATLEISMALPPTMRTAGSGLELTIGDLMLTAKDAAGVPVQTFALSLTTTLVAGPSGDNRLVLTTTTPVVKAQVLSQDATRVENPLDAMELEGIITGVWGVVGGMADDALSKLPMPVIAGIQLGAPTVQGDAGYVVLDVGAP